MTILNKNYLYSFALFYLIAISWSPLVSSLLGVSSTILYYPIVLILLLSLIIDKNRIDIRHIFLILFFTIIVLSIGLFLDAMIYINRYVFFPIIILVIYLIHKKEKVINILCTFLTVFSLSAIMLAIISFIYAYLGNDPILSIENNDGRENMLYLFSLSNSVIGNVIRPSFIYDEPGAFAFFLTFVILYRISLDRNSKVTMLILFGGLISFSLAYMFIVLLYIFVKTNKYIIISVIIIGILGLNELSKVDEFKFFFKRFEITSSGKFHGDNRSKQIENYFEVVNLNNFLFGNYKCYKDKINTCDIDISSSPVTPIYKGGLLIFLIQSITHLILIILLFKNKKLIFSALALSFILLQRPYFTLMGYQIMIYLLVSIFIYNSFRNLEK